MEAAGLSNKALARAVREAGRRRRLRLSTDHTTVKRWLDGTNPRGDTAACLVEAVSARLGRVVPPYEIGLASSSLDVPPDLALTYEASLADVVRTLGSLARLDADKHPFIVQGKFAADAVNALCLDWAFAVAAAPLPSIGDPVTPQDVLELRATRAAFDSLDRSFGGGRHRVMAVSYIDNVVVPRLNGALDSLAGRDYLREAAILCELVGWMTYDQLNYAAAQRYFSQAVRLADAGEDQGCAAFALTSLAAEALWLNQPREALRLARVALDRSSTAASQLAIAESLVFQGRALAALGDAKASADSIRRAEHAYGLLDAAAIPEWGRGWSPLVLASHAATCLVDLGEADPARLILEPLWDGAADQPRRRTYVAVQLARAALLTGDVEEASQRAVEAAAGQTAGVASLSARLVDQLRQRLLTAHGQHQATEMVVTRAPSLAS
jgi:tetratricopeptide (TPR) repeat protein